MTSKTELKELIESLRSEVRELKTEIAVMKTLIVTNNTNVVYPYRGTTQDPQKTFIPYRDSGTNPHYPPTYPTITISKWRW